MSGILQDSTDPELRAMQQQTEAKVKQATGGKGSMAQDTDAGLALAVVLSAVTGGISNVIEAVAATVQEVKQGSAYANTGMPGKKQASRFVDPPVAQAPKQKSIDLMSRSAAIPQAKTSIGYAGLLDVGGIKLANQSLSGMTGMAGAKTSINDLAHPKIDTNKLKFELGAIKKEIAKDADITPVSQTLSRRDAEKLARGVDTVEKKVEQSPIIKKKFAQQSAAPTV